VLLAVMALAPPATAAEVGPGEAPIPPPAWKTPKLDARLARVAEAAREGGVAFGTLVAVDAVLDHEGQRIRVVVEPAASVADATAAVRAAGGSVEAVAARLIQALVPPGRIAQLSAAGAVAYVRPPVTPQPRAVGGEGVATAKAAAWHGINVRGDGV
jgi:hypothetical protein